MSDEDKSPTRKTDEDSSARDSDAKVDEEDSSKKRPVDDDDSEEPPAAKRAYISERGAADDEPPAEAASAQTSVVQPSLGMGGVNGAPGDTTTLKVMVPNSKAGYIIGRQGSSIQQIRECSGARVNMSDNAGSDRVVSSGAVFS
jgi:hypothetical protein